MWKSIPPENRSAKKMKGTRVLNFGTFLHRGMDDAKNSHIICNIDEVRWTTSCEQNNLSSRTTSIPSWERWKISHSPKNTLRRWVSTFPHCFWGYASVPLEECINLHWPFWSEKVSTVFRSEKSPMLCASWCVLRLYCSLRRLGFKMRKKTGTRSGLVRNVGRSIWYDLTKISMTYEIVQDIVTR